jgi:hypothetical protein
MARVFFAHDMTTMRGPQLRVWEGCAVHLATCAGLCCVIPIARSLQIKNRHSRATGSLAG